MKLLPPDTVQFETCIECDVTGVVSKEAPLINWTTRSPAKGSLGNGEQQQPEPGLIAYQVAGQKKNISFYAKDIDMKHFPRLGDKVNLYIRQCSLHFEIMILTF